MANQKVTDLAAKTTVLNTDTYHVVDTTDTSQDPAGSSYKTTWASIAAKILTLFTASTGITYSGGVIGFDPTAIFNFTHTTLTNPTITTPTITGPTITGTTILSVGSDATGDIHYRSPGGSLARLALGSNGQYLGSNGTIPTWGTPSAPSGSISMFAGASAPTNWLLCDGSAVSRSTYANLFAVCGTTYGPGDGSTTFNLPNFKGKVPVGYDASETEFNALAKSGGEKTHVLITSEMPSHTHTVPYDSGGTGNNVLATQTNGALGAKTSSSTGGDGAHNNLQPYLTINFIIAI